MAWLSTFLIGLLEPLIQKMIQQSVAKILLDMKLSSVAKQNDLSTQGFQKLNAAKTDEEYSSALDDIAHSW